MRQNFTEEEVNAILRKAVERQPLGNEMSRAQMEALASEIGIAPDALSRAEVEWTAEQTAQTLRRAFDAERRAAFKSHVVTYLAVNAFLFVINAIMEGDPWFIFPLLGWGLALFFDAYTTFRTGPKAERAFHKWLDKQERRHIPNVTGPNTYATPERRQVKP